MSALWLKQYQECLSQAPDPIQAAGMAAYMKHQFTFLGIPSKARRTLTAPIEKAAVRALDRDGVMALAHALYQQTEREYHYCAIDLLVRAQRQLTAVDLAQLATLITQHSWWDSVDLLASKVIGPLVKREPILLATMDAWVSDENLWLRRTAILYQLSWANDTDSNRLFAACLRNAGDNDFFIRKAIGWALRQFARYQLEAVAAFVAQHQQQLSPLSRREALKHLINTPIA